jgi:two-component system, NarL family, sensor histidine kinase EvgS
MATRLLVVDDDPDMRELLPLCFRNLPVEVDTAGDGREALTKVFTSWESQPYDGVLMDCAMPLLDGPTVALLIREAEEKAQREPVKIGFVTAYGEQVEAGRFPAKAQATFYLRKPVDLDQLRDGIFEWLQH